MISPYRLLALASLSASTLVLSSCFGSGPILGSSGGTIATLTVSPTPTFIPQGTTVTFTSTVTGATNSPSWILSAYAYANLGTPTTQIGGSTYTYTAPPTPPIYTAAAGLIPPGTVTLLVSQGGANSVSIPFTITSPSVSVAITPTTATVALGATQVFNGYAIGAVNNKLTPQVNGVAGGSTATGTIAANPLDSTYGRFTYTAPTTMPMTGPTVTITYVSQSDPTKTATAVVTLH